jgi:hypothetical protein
MSFKQKIVSAAGKFLASQEGRRVVELVFWLVG